MADRLPTGISVLDRQLDGGIPPGSILLLSADPASQSESLLYEIAAARGTLYVTTIRSEQAVRDAVDRYRGRVDQLTIRDAGDYPPIDNATRLVKDLPESSNLLVDVVDPLEEADPTRYRAFLNELQTHMVNTGSIAVLHAMHGHDDPPDVAEQRVDIGATDEETAAELVEVGDPVTFTQQVHELADGRLTARGMDNRIGIWAAAEGLRRAAAEGADATVYAVSTVQEEVGLQGARMVGFDLDPDAVIATDVTHATDSPGVPSGKSTGVELSEGPVVARGSANHPALVAAVRDVAAEAEIDVQLQATGSRTGTDADAFYTSRGGTPSLNVGLPNRYMHTPVEVIDTDDLDAVADLLAAFADQSTEYETFAVDV